MSRNDLNWGVWLAAAGLTFAHLERKAFRQNAIEKTLSATLRRWLGIYPRRKGSRLTGMGFLLALGWIAAHIMDGFGKDK
jgi:hypothetical protein